VIPVATIATSVLGLLARSGENRNPCPVDDKSLIGGMQEEARENEET